MSLFKWIDFDLLESAGFSDDHSFVTYIGGHPSYIYYGYRNGNNLIVVQLSRHNGKRTRSDFYFGTIEGKKPRDCPDEAEYNALIDSFDGVAVRRNRVAGCDLAKLIEANLEVLDSLTRNEPLPEKELWDIFDQNGYLKMEHLKPGMIKTGNRLIVLDSHGQRRLYTFVKFKYTYGQIEESIGRVELGRNKGQEFCLYSRDYDMGNVGFKSLS